MMKIKKEIKKENLKNVILCVNSLLISDTHNKKPKQWEIKKPEQNNNVS